MSISDACKKRWFEQIKQDYPNIPDDMISTILDLYQTDKDFIDAKIKELKKENKGKPLEIKNKLSLEEMEKLYELGLKNQEEIERSFSGGVIKADEEEVVVEEKI
jgi:hypothetical protein